MQNFFGGSTNIPSVVKAAHMLGQFSNQQLFSTPFCPSRALQRMMSRCIFWHGQVLPARSNSHAAGQHTHTQIIPNPSQSSKHLISHDNCKKTSCLRISMSQMEAELKLPLVQNSQSRGYAALTHAANCASNVCGQMADFLIPWLNLVHCGPCLRCHPRAGSNQLRDFHHGD